jgi:hypothetical protein
MEMIDVLNRLKEIQESRPGVVDDAVANLENLNPRQPVPEDIDDHGMIVLQKAGFDPAKVKAYMAVFNDHGDTSDIDQMNIEKVGLADAMSMVLASHDVENESVAEAPQTEGAVKGWLMDMEQDAAEMSKEEFIKKHGSSHMDIWNRIQQEKEELGESKKTLVKEEDAYDNDRFMIKNGKATKDNSDTADKKDHVYAPDAKTALQLHKQGKKVYKESIQITADTPEEASMMMRMLQMAGVKSLDQDMINQPDTASSCGGCDENCECGGNCGDNCACGNKTDEDGGFMGATTTPNTKVQDTDTLVNFHSGGLNRQKKTFPKVAGGDNPMQRTESLSDSLRTQYAEFKANYQSAVTEAKKSKSPYAVGMAQAMKSTGDKPPLKKATIKKAHDIAKAVKKGK